MVLAMYLSAPEVALSTWGAITNVELCLFSPLLDSFDENCGTAIDFVFFSSDNTN